MAEALVNVLLERLVNLTIDKLQEELKLVAGVEEDVKNLTRNLEAIRAVLEDAEQRQVMEASVLLWLSELNDVSYEIDDVVDEWITRVLMQQMEGHENQGDENALVTTKKKKVCFPIPSCCFCFTQVKELGHRRGTALMIKDLTKKLAEIDEGKQKFTFDITKKSPELLVHRQETTSSPDYKTFGRDEEKEAIISKLLIADQQVTVPLVIPIVGMGGLGKTTISQLVYNDQKVNDHFDKKIWVCVSDPFVEVSIAKAIIQSLDKNNSSKDSNILQHLNECIGELIKGKKFLLVLDDVWSPTLSQWEELIKPFRRGVVGSAILVTTRNEEVAAVMKATTNIIHLKKLGEKYCSSLFYNNADMDISRESQKFQEVGEKLIKKCDGLPLALKTLGSYMNGKKTLREWQEVLESKIWESKEIEENVFRPLSLSYNGLTPMIKRCLLYCVIFPKDYMIKKDNLIELWMSQDYLKVSGNKDMEIIGQRCFDHLVKRSFFQDLEVDDGNGQITCKMHDIVHDFLQYLTKNECFTLDVKIKASQKIEVPGDKVRHLTLMHASERECLDSFGHCKSLRTLAAFNTTISICMELILQLKCLRTLNLSDSGIKEIPIEIGELIHLRYLDLSKNKQLKELPDTMSNLYNLQTLLLIYCGGLEKVEMGRLVNLRHLHVSQSEKLRLVGLEKLTNLQTLDVFYVNYGCEGNKLADLQNLNQLQGRLALSIKVDQQVVSEATAEKSILVNKHRLLHLDLRFPYSEDASVEEQLMDRQILDACQPPSGLEYLRIVFYRGTGLSTHWLLSLQSLTTLFLSECYKCEVLPPLGKLPYLESLKIYGLFAVKKVGVELLGIDDDQMTSTSSFNSFPKLKHLEFWGCYSWSEWEGARQLEDSENKNITTRTIMPCLSSLRIRVCPALKAMPDFLWKTPLRTLKIEEFCEILEDVYKARTGEEWAKISHIPNIKLDYRGWIQEGEE